MDRRTFHKLMTTAVMGNGIGLMRGQESGISLYGNLERPVLIPKLDSLPKEPLAIGTRKQLFVDRLIVAQTDEVLFTVVAPQKYPGNPIFVPEVPSDGQMISPVAVGWNEQKKLFQLWYDAMHMEMGKERHFMAYAESADGLRWRRPELGVREFDGSLANNFVAGNPGTIIYDQHETNPDRRYKSVSCDKRGVTVWFSADGIRWAPSAKNPVLPPASDTFTLMGWDERSKKYIGYFRPATNPETNVHMQRRQIGLSFSDDGENWTPIVPIIVADTHDPPGTEFYYLSATPYEDIYMGILTVLHLDADRLDCLQLHPVGQEQVVDAQVVCSRDGIHWDRMGNRAPWLSLGPYQSWDDQGVWLSVPIMVGDEIWVHYGGTSVRHAVSDLKQMREVRGPHTA